MYVQRPIVPVVVVFTQFDKLINRMYPTLTAQEKKKPAQEISVLCTGKAHAEFEKLCVTPLKGIEGKLRPASKLPYARLSGLIFSCKRRSVG